MYLLSKRGRIREHRKRIFGHRCAYCGQKPKHLTIDHVIPKSHGGSDEPRNLVPACLSCNGKKKNLDLWDWYKYQSFFCEKRWQRVLSLTDYVVVASGERDREGVRTKKPQPVG